MRARSVTKIFTTATIAMKSAIATGLALSLVTCASAPPIENCPVRSLQNTAPSQECLSEAAARQFLLESGHRIGNQLMGWRDRPSAVTLAVEFAPDASVASVCLRESDGLVVASRVRRAAAQMHSLATAPSCFANRRVEFAWESPTVTGYEIRQAERECDAAADLPNRRLYFCNSTQTCQVAEIIRLKKTADVLVGQCVLQRVPISIVASDTAEIALFLPVRGGSPDARHALDSLEKCDRRDRQSDGIACMNQMGWRRIE